MFKRLLIRFLYSFYYIRMGVHKFFYGELQFYQDLCNEGKITWGDWKLD